MTRDDLQKIADEAICGHILGFPGEGLVGAITDALVAAYDQGLHDAATYLNDSPPRVYRIDTGAEWACEPAALRHHAMLIRAKKIGGAVER